MNKVVAALGGKRAADAFRKTVSMGLIEDIVISIVVFLVVSLRNTDGTVFQGAKSVPKKRVISTVSD